MARYLDDILQEIGLNKVVLQTVVHPIAVIMFSARGETLSAK
jgi:hypothetical protein